MIISTKIKFTDKKQILVFLVVVAFALMGSFFAGKDTVASTVYNASNCSACHGTYVSDFTFLPNNSVQRVAKFDAAGNVTSFSACWECHREGYHGLTRSNRVFVSGAGFFSKTNQAVNTNYQILHFAHDGYNGGKNTAATNSCATKCHGPVSCTACHKQAIPHTKHGATAYSAITKILASGTSYSAQTISCSLSQCHQSMPNVKLTNTNSSQLCVNCHPRLGTNAKDSTGHPQQAIDSSHTAPVTGTLNLAGGLQTVTCQGCHSNNLAVEHANKGKDCLVCHKPAGPIPLSVKTVVTGANGAQSKRACTQCHFNNNVLIVPSEHRLYHIANKNDNLSLIGDSHAKCDTCHGKQELWPTISTLAAGNPKNYSCFDCHNAQNNLAPRHSAKFDGVDTEVTGFHQSCSTCHTTGTEASKKVGLITTKLNGGVQSYDCVECHNATNLSNAHVGIIDSNCTQTCHQISLIDEHISNPVTQKKALSCSSCHKSSSVDVRMAIITNNRNCAACHNQAHNLNVIQQQPADIPLYSGYQWSVPQPSDIWANETWMPRGYQGGKLLISNRRNDVDAQSVWTYYKQNMSLNGWTPPATEPAAASNFFSAEFSKGTRRVTVFFYGGENHAASPLVGSGYRLELLYK